MFGWFFILVFLAPALFAGWARTPLPLQCVHLRQRPRPLSRSWIAICFGCLGSPFYSLTKGPLLIFWVHITAPVLPLHLSVLFFTAFRPIFQRQPSNLADPGIVLDSVFFFFFPRFRLLLGPEQGGSLVTRRGGEGRGGFGSCASVAMSF